jgi:tripartite-type tricarboxylate transporter receptor subunit TctC
VKATNLFALCVLGLCIVTCDALAAAWPERPVRIIVTSQPGGGSDTTFRVLAPKLTEFFGQQVVVENRAGVSGNIGAEAIARAAPDGYTLGTLFSSHTSNVAVMKSVPFDLLRDFAPITNVVTMPNLLFSHPSVPAKNVKELVAFAKTRPGQLNYATSGIGSNAHLSMVLFLNMTGLTMTHVPYKSSPSGVIDVMAGHVPLMMANMVVAVPNVRNGRLRAYGVTSAARSSGAPELPTIAEMGLPGYEAVQWYSLVAPANTPRDIIMKVHASTLRALQDPGVRKRLNEDGAEPTPSATPEEFGAMLRSEIAKWGKVVKAAGIQPE